MPLVRIDLVEGRTDDQLRTLADVIQEVLEEVFAAPARDRYQIITEHRPAQMIIQDTGLGIERSDQVVFIQVTQQGRDAAQKQALYAELAKRLAERCDLRPDDLVVSIASNTPEDWSFGNGRAQFLTGEL